MATGGGSAPTGSSGNIQLSKCSKCRRKVVNGIKCFSCDQLIHTKCASVGAEGDGDVEDWICVECLNGRKQRELNLLKKRVKDLEYTGELKKIRIKELEQAESETYFGHASSSNTFNAQLLSQLECPVCLETFVPPIFMCVNGHCVCSKCRARLNACSTCRVPGKPKLRCMNLEKIAALLKYPCANRMYGCQLAFSMDEMPNHLLKCAHGYQCRLCDLWKGSALMMKPHVLRDHPSKFLKCTESGSLVMLTSAPVKIECHDKTYFILLGFNDDLFWLEDKYNSATRIYSRTLRVLGRRDKDESGYYYSFEFKSKDKYRAHRVFLQGDVLIDGASTNGDMDIVIPNSIVDSFQNGFIECTLEIKRKIY